jgi:ABC-type transport system substrate-binding protein
MVLGRSRRPRTRGSRGLRHGVAVMAALVLVLSACNQATTSGPPSAGTGTGASAQPGGSTPPSSSTTDTSKLVAAVGSLGTGEWAPARTGDENQEVSKYLFSTLLRVNHETKEFDGLLAESYSVSPDGLTWTFKLRPDVPFHDDWGTVTAEDVKFSWAAWIGVDSNHDLGPTLSAAVDGNMDNFKIISPLEFSVTATKPVVTLPSILSDWGNGLQVVPKRYYDEKGAEANNHPIGTGPFKFNSQTLGVEVVFDAVKDHFFQAPAFDQLVLKEIADSAARLAQVQSGELDIALLDTELVDEATAAGLEFRVIPDVGNVFIILGGSYWGTDALDADSPWIQADAPEKGKAIREAMSLAIDKELILDRILKGQGQLASGPVIQSQADPRLVDDSATFPPYDAALAKQKLAEGGYPDGFPITLFMYPDYIDLPGIGEAIAGMWEEIGIQVTRQPGEEGILDERLNATDTDGLAWVKVAGIKADPSTQLNGYRSTREDDHKFFHPSIDEGYDAMLVEPDEDKRFEIARDVIAALRDDTIAISLFTTDLPFVVGPKVGTWDPIPGLDELTGLETITPR